MIRPNDVVLFQGDSITDVGRNREDTTTHTPFALGGGYAKMVAARLLSDFPGYGLQFYNRGISGNRIVDLDARIKVDTIHLKPSILSVLIGVNDLWHHYTSNNGVDPAKFERVYRSYLTEVKEALPSLRFVLCEPFLLPCGVAEPAWIEDMKKRREIVRNLADEFQAIWVPFQEMFDRALQEAPAEMWALDGVHPTAPGHYRMACFWIQCVTDTRN